MHFVSITSSVFSPSCILNLVAVSETFNGHIPFRSRVPFPNFESCFLYFDLVRKWISGFLLVYEVFNYFNLNCSECACFNFEILCMILEAWISLFLFPLWFWKRGLVFFHCDVVLNYVTEPSMVRWMLTWMMQVVRLQNLWYIVVLLRFEYSFWLGKKALTLKCFFNSNFYRGVLDFFF